MEAAVTNLTVTPEHTWSEHCLSAVKRFIKNAVIIDNEPVLGRATEVVATALNQPDSTGMGGGVISESAFDVKSPSGDNKLSTIPSADNGIETIDAHTLDIRQVTDAFVEAGIACSFVLPCDEDSNEENKITRVLSAAKLTDIVVIDWYLHNDSPTLTMRVLKELAKSDTSEGGRLRLIAVYTGQVVTDAIFRDIKNSLNQGGISVNNVEGSKFIAKNDSCLIIAINKDEIKPAALPEILFNSFAMLSDGLIPSFTLAAVGAIRKNMHHLATRFSRSLDSAYVSNRLITNPPGDVAELMRELLVSEFDSAIGLEKVADDYLDDSPVKKWINKSTIVTKKYNSRNGQGTTTHTIDKNFIFDLLESGIGDEGFKSQANSNAHVPFPTKERHLISAATAGSDDISKENQNCFSRLVAFKREAIGGRRDNDWRPSLTTGTLLRRSDGVHYLCLTPACDTLRLRGSSSFVFLEAQMCTSKYSIVLKNENGDDIKLKFERKRPKISTFSFAPDETERVRGTEKENVTTGTKTFNFITDDPVHVEFTWMGEIRYGRAASEMAQLVGNWMRIGINDSEYLRLIDAGKFSG